MVWIGAAALTFFKDAYPAVVLAYLILSAIAIIGLCIRGIRRRPFFKSIYALFVLALILSVPFAFMGSAFGARDLNSLLISIQENQIGDLFSVGIEGFSRLIGKFFLYVSLALFSAWILMRWMPFGNLLVSLGVFYLVATGPVAHFIYRQFVPDPNHALIADRIANLAPDILVRPSQKKNLILVYLESVERTYQDIPLTQPAFAPLAEIQDESLYFANVGQVHGTGHTIGGMVATQCGLPLVEKGIFSPAWKHRRNHDALPDTTDFFPAQVCLGDILRDDGYVLSYLNGSSLDIYSKGDFFRGHGYSHVNGLYEYAGWEDEERRNVWGLDDDLLFERVKVELARLAGGNDPFVLATLTIATHGPDGYPDSQCDIESFESPLIASLYCTGTHVADFLAEVQKLGLQDDTLVVILSDHLAYRNAVWDVLKERREDRRNFITVLGANETGPNTQAGAMVDIYPTLLELLGYKIKASQAGLGVSLISTQPTLSQLHGRERFSSSMVYNVDLKQELWREPESVVAGNP